MPETVEAPAKEVIDMDASMDTGVLTKVKIDAPDEAKVKAEAEAKAASELEAKKKADEEAEKSKEEEDEEEEELTEEEKKEEEESEKEKEEEEEESDSISEDEFVKDQYFEKYEVENREQLDELLEVGVKALEENKKLKKQLEEAGTAKPKFASDHEEKAFELVKSFASLGDGAGAMANLISMDIDKSDSKSKLKLQYILEHPDVESGKAEEQFERLYKRKYTVKDKEKFDTEEEYEDAKKDAEFDLENDSAKAKKYLKSKQEEVRTKPQTKEEKSEDKKVPEVVQQNIERNVTEITKYTDGFTSLTFSPDDDASNDFTFKLKPEQIKAVKNSVLNWVNNPAMYNEKGKFIQDFNPEEMLKRATGAMFFDELFGALTDHMHTLSNVKRADEISKKKVVEKSKGKGNGLGEMDEYAQAEHLARSKKKQRERV